MPSTFVYLDDRPSGSPGCGLLDVLRRIEIRFAGTKADDVATGKFERRALSVTAIVADGLMRCSELARNPKIPP